MANAEDTKLSPIAVEISVVVILLIALFGFLGAYFDRLLDWYEAMVAWLRSRDAEHWARVVTILFGTLNLLIIVGMLYIRRVFHRLRATPLEAEALAEEITPAEEVREQWEQIQQLAASTNPSDWNMAILRSDALLDDALIHKGYEGETLADRLKIVSPTTVPSLDRLWSAHRLRNVIAHEPLEQHPKEQIRDALASYQQAFVELGMLEKTEATLTKSLKNLSSPKP